MKKIAALDIGDQWTGVALSDALCCIATPITTIETGKLVEFLGDFFEKQHVEKVIVGIPIPSRGEDSEQTKKVRTQFAQLKDAFPKVTWQVSDERFSSKQASELQKKKSNRTIAQRKEEKLKNHAIAAAIILETYLQVMERSGD